MSLRNLMIPDRKADDDGVTHRCLNTPCGLT
jgi:hypothetical protein